MKLNIGMKPSMKLSTTMKRTWQDNYEATFVTKVEGMPQPNPILHGENPFLHLCTVQPCLVLAHAPWHKWTLHNNMATIRRAN